MSDANRHTRPVKPAAVFADKMKIEGFMGRERLNPRDLAPEDFEAYKIWYNDVYSKEEMKRRARKSYENRKEAGTAPQRPRIGEIEDEDEKAAARERNRVSAAIYRAQRDPKNSGKSKEQIKQGPSH